MFIGAMLINFVIVGICVLRMCVIQTNVVIAPFIGAVDSTQLNVLFYHMAKLCSLVAMPWLLFFGLTIGISQLLFVYNFARELEQYHLLHRQPTGMGMTKGE